MRRITTLLLVCVITIANSFAQVQQSIEVVGTAEVKAIPEQMLIHIPIYMKDSTYLDCSQKLMKKFATLQKDLKKCGLLDEQVKISNFSINENYEYNHELEKSVKIGYRGSGNLQIEEKYSAELIQKIINVLEKNESTFNLNFKLSEVQKESLRKEAIKKAVADAKEKAHTLRTASGIILGDIVNISYGRSIAQIGSNHELMNEVIVRGLKSTPNAYTGSVTANLSPKEMSISTSVLIKWAIDY